jgi:hypothetical protein
MNCISTGCFAFASGGELLNDLLNSHPIHLLSIPHGHNIEKGRAGKYSLGVWLYNGNRLCTPLS